MDTKELDQAADAAATSEMEALTKEIDAAVDDVVKAGKPEVKPDKEVDDDNKDLPDAEALAAEEAAQAEAAAQAAKGKVDEPDQPVITDSHVERAIKAGMSIADAKSFANVEVFDRVCSMLETKQANGDDSSATGKTEGDADALLANVPDLDPEEYDENIVNAFKSVKDILRQQLTVNAELRQQGSKSEVDWLDTQIQGLGEGFAEAVGSGAKATLQSGSPQAAKRAEVERKFKVLEAGYKAAGEDVARESVFKEAVSLTLGDVAAQADTAKKEAALKARQKQMLNRADGAKLAPTKDAFDDTAEELNRKFFGKN